MLPVAILAGGLATRLRPDGLVSFGLGGPEVGVPRAQFAPHFAAAKAAGLRSVPHAGESTGPETVWDAIDNLGDANVEGHEGEPTTVDLQSGYRVDFKFGEYDPSSDSIKLDEGKLDFIDNEILQTTGSVRFRADFPNPAHRLWPGELINVWLLIDTRHNGLTVSAPAVQQGPQGAYVYVIGSDSKVEARSVKVAQVSGGQALIDSGLTANEKVVVDGQYKLQPGARVTILTGKAAEQAAAQSAQQTPIP